jgi:hypothetical protein
MNGIRLRVTQGGKYRGCNYGGRLRPTYTPNMCSGMCAAPKVALALLPRARLAHARRAATELVNLGRTLTPEFTCDAVTYSTLSAGNLAR